MQFPPHLNYVATLPREIRKFTIYKPPNRNSYRKK